jgi:hypothetical protein
LGGMEDQAESWFRRRTSHWLDWPLERLLRWKASQGARVSVVIPAHDEEATVGASSRPSPARLCHAVWSTNWL